MKKTAYLILALSILLSCIPEPEYYRAPVQIYDQGSETGGGGQSGQEGGTGVDASYKTGVPELSGICFSADSSSFFAVSDRGGLYCIDASGKARLLSSTSYDLEGVTVNRKTGKVYLIAEKQSALLKYESGTVSKVADIDIDAEDPSGKGIEGVAWYKDDQLLIANQAEPTRIVRYSLGTGSVQETINISFASYLSDICYDSSDNSIWIVDSKSQAVHHCKMDGTLLKTFSQKDLGGGLEALEIDSKKGLLWIGKDDDNIDGMLYKKVFKF